MGFAILGQNVVIFILATWQQLFWQQASMSFWLLSCTFVFQSAAVVGGRFSNPPTPKIPVDYVQAV